MSRAHAASVGCAYCVGFSGELSSDPLSSRLMETALYYTLSTIAQTLAGALAILVAVVLFKLSALAKEHEASADILNQHSVDADVVDIAACFIGLPFTPRLASSPWAPCLLVFTVGLGIVCLLLYVWLIVAIVRKPAG